MCILVSLVNDTVFCLPHKHKCINIDIKSDLTLHVRTSNKWSSSAEQALETEKPPYSAQSSLVKIHALPRPKLSYPLDFESFCPLGLLYSGPLQLRGCPLDRVPLDLSDGPSRP